MPTYEELTQAVLKADAAGDIAGAQVLADMAKQMRAPPAPIVPPKPATERTWGEAGTDLFAAGVKGLGGVAQLPGQIYGLSTGDFDNMGMRGPQTVKDWGESLQSQGLKVRQALADTAISEAAKKGMISEFKEAIWQTIKDPALASTFLAEEIPQIIPSAITGGAAGAATTAARQGVKYATKEAAEAAVKQTAKVAGRVGEATALGTGAVQQGADVGHDTYEDALKLLADKYPDMPEQERKDIALSKARMAAIEGGGISLAAQKLPGARAIERRIAKLPGQGRIRGALGEAASEIAEEGGGKFASNVGLQEIDPTRDLSTGVGQAAGMGALGGALMGGALGAHPPAPEVAPVAPPAAPPVAPATPGAPPVASAAPATLTPEQNAKVAALTAQYIAHGYDEVIAPAVALKTVTDEAQAAAPPAPEAQAPEAAATAAQMGITPEVMAMITAKTGLTSDQVVQAATLTGKYVSEGMDPQQASAKAHEEVKANVEQPNQPTGGAGVSVASVPDTGVTAPGTQPTGVVPIEQDVGKPAAREGQQPVAVTPITGFTTSKGSVYTVDEQGRTGRTKNSPGEGQGTTYAPHPVLYISPTDTNELLSDMQGGRGKNAIRLGHMQDGKFVQTTEVFDIPANAQPVVAVINRDTGQIVGQYNGARTPAVGLHPVEKLYTSDGKGNTHIGNAITTLSTAGYLRRMVLNEQKAATAAEFDQKYGAQTTETKQAEPQTQAAESTEEVTPDHAESQRMDDALRGKTFDEALAFAIKNASDAGQKAILQKAGRRIQELKAKGFEFAFRLAGKGQELTNNALGLVQRDYSGLGQATRIEMILNGATGRSNTLQQDILAHELVHTATAAMIDFAPLSGAARQLRNLQQEVVEEFNRRAKAGTLNAWEKRIYEGRNNALKDAHELLAWGLTDKNMQNWLASMEDKSGKSWLSKLYDIVANVLNLNGKEKSVLARLMSISEDIFVESLEEYQAQANKEGKSFGKQANTTGYPSWALKYEGDVVWAKGNIALYKATAMNGNTIYIAGKENVGQTRVDIRSFTGNTFTPEEQRILRQAADKLQSTAPSISEATSAPPAAPTASTTPPIDARSQAEVDREVKTALEKNKLSRTATETAENTNLLYALREGKNVKNILVSNADAISNTSLSALLGTLPGDVVASMGSKALGNENLNTTNSLIGSMRGMSHQLLKAAGAVHENLVRAIGKEPSLRSRLEEVIYVSTTSRVDPSVDTRSAVLNKMYNDLGPNGQRLYKEMKQYYESMVNYYSFLLDEQINSANLPPGAHTFIMAEIKKIYEADKRINPYFPLVRHGDLWLRVGEKGRKEFYTFATNAERDAVMREIAKRKGTTVEDMLQDKKQMDRGDDLTSFRIAASETSEMLKAAFSRIDSIKNTGAQTQADFDQSMSDLKDSMYELYLTSMPEQSFRKSFIERKDVTGYSTDVVRNFSTSATHMASQLSRIAFGGKIRNSLTAAQASLEGNPNKVRYERYVQEMQRRASVELHPFADPPAGVSRGVQKAGQAVGSFLTRLSFIHYLSSASSALIQFTAIPYGMANLGARHGYYAASKEFARMMRLNKEFGIRRNNSDGSVSFVSPSIAESANLTADEKRAMKDMGARGVDITLTNEILGRGRMSSLAYEGKANAIKRGVMTAVGGLFHNTERISREFIYMMSYRLARKAGKTHEEAVDQAVVDTYDSAGNMSEWNRAPIFRGVTGRIALQFLSYPLYQTVRIAKTFTKMLPLLNKEGKSQAFKEFVGIMGTTWLLAGTVGLPMFSVVMGFVGMALKGMKDDDQPEELKTLNFEEYFKQVWIPEHLGEMTIGGKPVSELVLRGPVNFFTGIDVSSRTSLNDMWFKDQIASKTPREGAIQVAVAHAGPSVNLILSYLDAIKAYGDGDMQKFGEKILPAVARGPLASMKYLREGAKGVHGEELLSQDSFTAGALLFQAIGFREDNLANLQDVNFKMYTEGQKISIERNNILRNIGDAYMKGQDDRFAEWLGKVGEFDRKYPIKGVVITGESIQNSLKKINEARGKNWRGLALTPQNIMLFMEAAAPSREAAEWLEKQSKAK